MICVDSSVAVKWSFVEEHSFQARALLRVALEQQEPIIAPPLLPSEVANVIRQRLRQRQLNLGEARALLAQFLAVPLWFQTPKRLMEMANKLPPVLEAIARDKEALRFFRRASEMIKTPEEWRELHAFLDRQEQRGGT